MKHLAVNKSGNKRGLARKGSKNLKKLDNGNFKNKNGVTFTPEEKKALEYKVNSAMAKRRRLLGAREDDIRTIFGVPQNYKVSEDFQSKDFLFAKKSKSLNKFTSKKQYNQYMANLDKILQRDYIDKRLDRYKDNYIKSISTTFGSDGKKAIAKLKKLDTKGFAKLMNSELFAGIQYIYNKEEYDIKLEGLNVILGVK